MPTFISKNKEKNEDNSSKIDKIEKIEDKKNKEIISDDEKNRLIWDLKKTFDDVKNTFTSLIKPISWFFKKK